MSWLDYPITPVMSREEAEQRVRTRRGEASPAVKYSGLTTRPSGSVKTRRPRQTAAGSWASGGRLVQVVRPFMPVKVGKRSKRQGQTDWQSWVVVAALLVTGMVLGWRA